MAACADDDGRTPSPAVDPNCIGASFVGDNIGYEELEDTDPKELTLTISRDKTEAAATVAIEVQANTENIFNIPQSVSFAAGQATADLVITFEKAQLKEEYSFQISLEAAAVNPYKGNGHASFTVQCLKWVDVSGTFAFKDWVFDEYNAGKEYNVKVQRVDGENRYRIVDPFSQALAESGEEVCFCRYPTEEQEAAGIVEMMKRRMAAGEKPEDMAVLFRSRRQMLAFVPLFVREGIPFYLRDHVQNPLEHWAVRDVEAYLLLAESCKGKMDRSLLLQVMNRPARYLARASLETERISFAGWREFYRGKDWICKRIDLLQSQLSRLAAMPGFSAIHYIRRTIGYDRFLEEYGGKHPSDESVREVLELVEDLARGTANIRELLKKIRGQRRELEQAQRARQVGKGVGIYTMHGAKGLEFDTVFVPGCCEGECPSRNAKTAGEVEEERRIFYVGVTRARRRLYLTWSSRDDGGQKYPSRFLKEMQEGPNDRKKRGIADKKDQSISSKAASSRSSSNRSSTRAYSSSSGIFSREGAPVSSSS